MSATTPAYLVTIDHRDGTSEHYTTSRNAAYALVLDELRAPTPGICRIDIRPVIAS